MTSRGVLLLGLLAPTLASARGAPEPPPEALFVVVVGVNRSVDQNLPTLRYADDDAARYFDLFRLLGARTYVLGRLDADTRRLHPQAAAEAQLPRHQALTKVIEQVRADVERARALKLRTAFYFIYAGHGGVASGEGYVGLEDARLSGTRLAREVIDPVRADATHLIVDACYSYYLAFSRGPGGQRRALHGFSGLQQLASRPSVGLLLSTSAARESHEWEAFQAGVFSHEVRSGLFGAADANGDGQVSYREIAAFVEQANAAIPNERFRPRIYARAPSASPLLLDLRRPLRRRLTVDGASGHHYLEDSRGVRLADFNNLAGHELRLLRPTGKLVYLRPLSDQREYQIPIQPEVVRLASLTPQQAQTQVRGAAHHAFSLIFSLPFDGAVVERFHFAPPEPAVDEPVVVGRPRWRSVTGFSALGLAALSLGTGVGLMLSARSLQQGAFAEEPQQQVADRNRRIDARNTAAGCLYGLAGAAAVGGALLLLWPSRSDAAVAPSAAVTPDGALFALSGSF